MQLVAADTKKPFMEHTAPDGQVYAEVEPDMDYFISLRSDIGGVMMFLSVDGVDLGYYQSFKKKRKKKYCGHRERKGENETMTALHFNKTREAHGVSANIKLTGKVEVNIHQRGDEYYKKVEDNAVSPLLAADSTLGGKKCIKSTSSGSHSIEKIRPSKKVKGNVVRGYKIGKHICTITLHYCSALGLIYNKILPPPPTLEGNVVSAERVGRKRKRSPKVATASVSPELNNSAADVEIVKKETDRVTVQLSYDLVDLTGDD